MHFYLCCFPCTSANRSEEIAKMSPKPNGMVDRISVLPHDIIDSILTRLEIKEAARTCILSRSWRHQWYFLSEININFNSFYKVPEAKFVKIIDHILHVHRGSVDKLELTFNLDARNDIVDQLILYASRNGVKELVIHNWDDDRYSISSCPFQCSDLTYLQLTNCMVKVKPPTAFKEFGKLTKLSFNEVVINSKVLENLITSCPLLNQLSLEEVQTSRSVKINAPKLVMFHIYGFKYFPRFMNTPLLDSAYFGLLLRIASVKEDCKVIEFLQSTPVLRKLELEWNVLQNLAAGDVPACLPYVCPIRQLRVCINFGDLRELQAAFCIFRSSPFIQHLQIKISVEACTYRPSDGFWKGEDDFSFKFDHLQTVKLYAFNGTESELNFIKFILSNAPALKTMSIGCFSSAAEKASVLTKLVRFPRISPSAELILPANWNR